MAAYFITGRQGTGKTSLIKELQKRGYAAYNTDDMPEVTHLQDLEGNDIPWPKVNNWETQRWNWQAKQLRLLMTSAEVVFIGAVTSNQADFYPEFTKLFYLTVTPQNLRKHLEQHEHGYRQNEIDHIIDHQYKQEKYAAAGGIAIQNDGPIEQTADLLLSYVD